MTCIDRFIEVFGQTIVNRLFRFYLERFIFNYKTYRMAFTQNEQTFLRALFFGIRAAQKDSEADHIKYRRFKNEYTRSEKSHDLTLTRNKRDEFISQAVLEIFNLKKEG